MYQDQQTEQQQQHQEFKKRRIDSASSITMGNKSAKPSGKSAPTPTPAEKVQQKTDESRVVSGPVDRIDTDGLASNFSKSMVHINESDVEIGKFYYGLRSNAIGKGGTSEVRVITSIATEKKYACKTIRLLRVPEHKKMQLMREIDIIRSLDHPNVIKVVEVFKQYDCLHIIMELCTGGELFDRLESQAACRFEENYVHELGVKMVRALHYLHTNGIIHRDLKLENFIYTSTAADADLKLIDFGYSRTYLEGEQMKSLVGTSYYIAPEVIEGNYGQEADLWSLGAVIYMLFTGELPVGGESDTEILNNVRALKTRKKKFGIAASKVKGVNMTWEAIDFINQLMEPDVKKRLTTETALAHPFIQGSKIDNPEQPPLDMEDADDVAHRVNKFRGYPQLKRAALMAAAFYTDDEGLSKLKAEFSAMDVNGDGVLSFEEFSGALSKHIDASEIKRIFDTVDQDGTHKIKYSEFLAACIDEKQFMKREQLMATFRALDTNGDGVITKEELMEKLGDSVTAEMVDQVIAEADFVKDGAINLEEFIRAMRGERVGQGPPSPTPANE